MSTAKAVRQVDAFPSREEAEDSLLTYAELLVQRGDQGRFGVFVGRIPGVGWGIFLRDRNVAR